MGPETARASVLIVVPCFQAAYPSALANFMAIMATAGRQCGDRYQFDVSVPARQALTAAMNEAGKRLLEHEHVAMIVFDDDCYPPVDVIPRLLAHYEAGHHFVAGAGLMRGFPHTTTIGRYFPEGVSYVPQTGELRGFEWVDDLESLPPLATVDFCGVPVALISRACFERATFPWFETWDAEAGGACTHDVFWAKRLKQAGIPVEVDTTIRCSHLAEAPVVDFRNRTMARRIVDLTERARRQASHG